MSKTVQKTVQKTVFVAAVVLINQNQQILMSTRPIGKSMAGYWEFPGGKLEAGETYTQAAIRELNEELGIDIQVSDLQQFEKIFHAYAEFNLEMTLFLCRMWKGDITPQENQNYNWFKMEQIDFKKIIPADIELVKRVFDYV